MTSNKLLPWLARLVWLVGLAAVVLTAVAIPIRLRLLATPCLGPQCVEDNLLPEPALAAVLGSLGVTLPQYARYQVGLALLQALLSWALAFVLVRRRPPEPMALLTALALATGNFLGSPLAGLGGQLPALALPANLVSYIGYVSFILVFYLFPDGRLVPRWTVWLALALAVDEFIYTFFPDSAIRQQAWYGVADGVIWLCNLFVVAASQLYRYRWVSGPVQRVQTRWVVFGLALGLLAVLALQLTGLALGLMSNPYYRLVFVAVLPWSTILVPLTLGLAVLRYRLWDIDLLIRRTLLYSLLTGLLAGIYFGSVVLLQAAFQLLFGQAQSALVTVLSTLAIAALFVPLRRRLQDFIDRRFYRHKVDAAQTLADFAHAARDEVDLDRLSAELVRVVQDTMQPETASLWLNVSK